WETTTAWNVPAAETSAHDEIRPLAETPVLHLPVRLSRAGTVHNLLTLLCHLSDGVSNVFSSENSRARRFAASSWCRVGQQRRELRFVLLSREQGRSVFVR